MSRKYCRCYHDKDAHAPGCTVCNCTGYQVLHAPSSERVTNSDAPTPRSVRTVQGGGIETNRRRH